MSAIDGSSNTGVEFRKAMTHYEKASKTPEIAAPAQALLQVLNRIGNEESTIEAIKILKENTGKDIQAKMQQVQANKSLSIEDKTRILANLRQLAAEL